MAFVFQNDRLFKGTLADNIRMGRPDASDGGRGGGRPSATTSSRSSPGLATRVGTDGVCLSRRECQRIALARAILKDARGGTRRGHGLRRP
ncbi:MAG: hypothetical protein ACLUW6_04890 [Coriobacteriaceae bacterium]